MLKFIIFSRSFKSFQSFSWINHLNPWNVKHLKNPKSHNKRDTYKNLCLNSALSLQEIFLRNMRDKFPSFIEKRNNIYQMQGRMETTFTYANAEVTFSLVKLLKNTEISIFSTKLLSSFLLPIENIRKSWAKSLPWLFCRSCQTSLHARHAVKTVCSRNIRKVSNNQENL